MLFKFDIVVCDVSCIRSIHLLNKNQTIIWVAKKLVIEFTKKILYEILLYKFS